LGETLLLIALGWLAAAFHALVHRGKGGEILGLIVARAGLVMADIVF
jgi:hypothetical protein